MIIIFSFFSKAYFSKGLILNEGLKKTDLLSSTENAFDVPGVRQSPAFPHFLISPVPSSGFHFNLVIMVVIVIEK